MSAVGGEAAQLDGLVHGNPRSPSSGVVLYRKEFRAGERCGQGFRLGGFFLHRLEEGVSVEPERLSPHSHSRGPKCWLGLEAGEKALPNVVR